MCGYMHVWVHACISVLYCICVYTHAFVLACMLAYMYLHPCFDVYVRMCTLHMLYGCLLVILLVRSIVRI